MSAAQPTMPQLEALSLLAACPEGFAEPGEIWLDHSSYANAPSAIGLRNFGRTMDALQRRCLVRREDGGYAITDAGRRVLAGWERK